MKTKLHSLFQTLKKSSILCILSLLTGACAVPNQAYNLPSVQTETSTIKKVVCPPTATTINLRFEGEALPLEYDKYAIVTTKSDLGIADDVHLLYLKNEANKSCANEILFLKSEELVYTQHRLDNPLTLIDESELPLTIREKQFTGIAVYNKALEKNQIIDTNYRTEIINRELKYQQYLTELDSYRSSARGVLFFGSALGLLIGFIWIEQNNTEVVN